MRFGTIAIALICVGVLSACGGGGGTDGLVIAPPTEPNTSQSASGAYANPDAIDPLPSFRAVSLPTASRFAYRLEAPAGSPGITITTYVAPGTTVPDDLIPMMRRAAELWTRRIAGFRMPNGHYHTELSEAGLLELDFLVGYQQPRCPSDACANHYGDHLLLPSGRANGGNNAVIMLDTRFLRNFVRNGQLSIGGFRILAHEFGHIVDHGDELNTGIYHSNCSGGAIMCDAWQSNMPAIPVERDFDGIRHHYDLRADTDHKEFGIWADVPEASSDLEHFGVQITRTLSVARATDIWDRLASGFIRDQITIEAAIEGTRSLGPAAGMGTATWSGDLIAVDTTLFQPVLGDANLSMDLEVVDSLDASFTDLHRTDETGVTHGLASLAYTLNRTGNKLGGLKWSRPRQLLRCRRRTPAVPSPARSTTKRGNLMGAFGALRDE